MFINNKKSFKVFKSQKIKHYEYINTSGFLSYLNLKQIGEGIKTKYNYKILKAEYLKLIIYFKNDLFYLINYHLPN